MNKQTCLLVAKEKDTILAANCPQTMVFEGRKPPLVALHGEPRGSSPCPNDQDDASIVMVADALCWRHDENEEVLEEELDNDLRMLLDSDGTDWSSAEQDEEILLLLLDQAIMIYDDSMDGKAIQLVPIPTEEGPQ